MSALTTNRNQDESKGEEFMNVLVINAGSSSLKYQLIDMEGHVSLFGGY